MIDPILASILTTAFKYGIVASLAAVAVRFFNRDQPGPRFDQTAAIGFLVGGAFGAFIGIFQSMITRLQ